MKSRILIQFLFARLLLDCFLTPAPAAEVKRLPNHVVHMAANLRANGRLPASRELHLVLGLPLRDPQALSNFVEQVYNPVSPTFRRYLTPTEVADRFGPTKEDYQAIADFAKTNGFQITATYPNRLVVDVTAKVSDIERTFHLTLHTYQHPTENREFYAPDAEPGVAEGLPLLDVSGLQDYDLPRPMVHLGKGADISGFSGGSGPGGTYRGQDFRNAYIPGVTLNGSGQAVGLVEFDGYYAVDITNYAIVCGISNTPLQNVLLSGATGAPSTNSLSVSEVSLDIEMVLAMAPNLSRLVVFEAPQDNGANWITMLNTMASNNQINQFSASWFIGSSPASGDQILQTMAAQGQSFFSASGDGDAYIYPVVWPSDNPYITCVGGTTLTMDVTGTKYASETVWNSGFLGTNNVWGANGSTGWWGSGGGASTTYPVPNWQKFLNLAALGASTTKRNVPDVALTANQIWIIWFNGSSGPAFGTSAAAPLWAGFTALVNQQAAASGKPPVGFLNPALYAIGKGAGYSSDFHDITNGNNTWSGSTNQFFALTGFDLCTGWGTPAARLIGTLADFAGPVWVDFSVPGPGVGTYDDPYNTLALGVSRVAQGGTVVIKGPTSSTERMTISKHLTINTDGGPALIGQ